MHMEGIKRIFRSGNCEFKAGIRVRTVTVMGRSDRSKEAVSLSNLQIYTTLSFLARMCIWFILTGEEDGCRLRCASDRIGRQFC